jgi:hypothetical protein
MWTRRTEGVGFCVVRGNFEELLGGKLLVFGEYYEIQGVC